MPMKELHTYLREEIGLSQEETERLCDKLTQNEFEAKTNIVHTGTVARSVYFIRTGLMRTYHLQDGKEITTYFACDHQFISTYASFINQAPSFETLEAIEDSSVYELSYRSLLELYEESPKFEKLGRILAERNYLCILDRTVMMQTKTAKQKYIDFIHTTDKKIVQRVPQHQIASFLGITPESLSRIRKQLVSS